MICSARTAGWTRAARQYETLARLAPDDTSVALLLAAAAKGRGLLEEAVKWTEKGGAAGAPDAEQSPARTAHAFAAAYLTWARIAAKEAGKKAKEDSLKARFDRITSAESRLVQAHGRSSRALLTWAHRSSSDALEQRPRRADARAGGRRLTRDRAGDVAVQGRRLRPGEARAGRARARGAPLGASATLTFVLSEGGEGESLKKLPISWSLDGAQGGRVVRNCAHLDARGVRA